MLSILNVFLYICGMLLTIVLAIIMMMNSCNAPTKGNPWADEQGSQTPVVRPATQANRFYEGNPQRLSREVDSLLNLHRSGSLDGRVAALVVPQLSSGTHTIFMALAGLLRPGDVMLSAAGRPYDTMLEAIGIEGNGQHCNHCSGEDEVVEGDHQEFQDYDEF